MIKPRYGYKAKLVMTDTDSFLIHIVTTDVYKDIAEISDLFDLSNYPKDHFLYDSTNKKVAGKMKDESCGVPKKVAIGLRANSTQSSLLLPQKSQTRRWPRVFLAM